MEYENFKEQFAGDISEAFEFKDVKYQIKIKPAKKIKNSYDALLVKPKDAVVGMHVDINHAYDMVQNGAQYDDVLKNSIKVLEEALDGFPIIDFSNIKGYEDMKDSLVMEIVSAEKNADLLEMAPHQTIGDMAVIYKYIAGGNDEYDVTFPVTNRIMDYMGIVKEQLHADALHSSTILRKMQIRSITGVISEMTGLTVYELETRGLVPYEPTIFVGTVDTLWHGAGVLAYDGFMEEAAERIGGDFYIMPLSIHEVILLPDNGNIAINDIQNMAKEAYRTQVKTEDRLTDNIYHYDSETRTFELVSKLENSQNQGKVSGWRFNILSWALFWWNTWRI